MELPWSGGTLTDMSKISAKLSEDVNKDQKATEADKNKRKRENYLYLKEHFKVTTFIMESGKHNCNKISYSSIMASPTSPTSPAPLTHVHYCL
jgi:ribosomal protein S2